MDAGWAAERLTEHLGGFATVMVRATNPSASVSTDYQRADALARRVLQGARLRATGYNVVDGKAARQYVALAR